ncbi:metal ABC transporter ATP-binding protein [Microbacterium koreense]|uniref:Metal ABC transporter ATP-binding protein n=1 Tax=Microbacterium koreense TaxID=323761 RepID=A0ABW2ZQP4_9MICO
MTPAITVENVSVRYGTVHALEDVSIAVSTGQVTGLIGTNGSGKSTLFKSILGLVRPDHGRVILAGAEPRAARRRGTLGYVPQSDDIDTAFPVSVRDVVMMGRVPYQGFTRRPRGADRDAVAEALARVDLAELSERQIGQLSGGQRKRAFVARALAQDASILLLDEPFAGVDKRSEAMIVSVLKDLAREGRTVLVSTHDLRELPRLADEAILLQRRVLSHGPVADVLTPENLAKAFGIDVEDDAA